jgi:hypothetical protein
MKKYTWTIMVVFFATACIKKDLTIENSSSKKPNIPTGYSIDIDSDNKSDFLVEYKELMTTDIPSSGGSIIGAIRPINDNQILYNNPNGYLFLEINDTIRQENGIMTTWSSFSADLTAIDRQGNIWGNNWKILSSLKSGYFLAYRNIKNNNKIGWLQFQVDTLTGEIKVLDKMLSKSDELIIKK